MKITQGLGWLPDHPDRRDVVFRPTALRLDSEGGLSPQYMPPKFNQGNLGRCTGASSGRGWGMYLTAKEGQPRTPLSANFPYYNGRLQLGTTSHDSGAMIRDVIKGVVKYGFCAPSNYFDDDPAQFSVKPSDKAYKEAHFTILDSYERIAETGPARIQHAKTALSQGWPVVFGFTVYESFMSQATARSGVMTMPLGSEAVVGGHAVWAWRWDDNRGLRIVNSWGPDWGIGGDFWMGYEYFETDNLVTDIWVLKSVT